MTDSVIALAGSPNCGKTALFNVLTGSHQKVANYPGVTVEHKEGSFTTKSGKEICVLDLPGTYSLSPTSADEQVALDVILEKQKDAPRPKILVCVADATNLERSLSLILEMRTIGKPVVFALNMMDLAKQRGLKLDLEKLEQELLVPVIPIVAVKGEGREELLTAIEKALETPRASAFNYQIPSNDEVRARFGEVDRILEIATKKKQGPAAFTEKLDRFLLHPVFAPIVLFSVLTLMFQAVFSWAEPFMGAIEWSFGALSTAARSVLGTGIVGDLIVDGIIAGVGSVVVFLPQIIFLFAFILLLEDTGYMARAAFVMDRMMKSAGLHGRAFIPLLSSYACAIPGIMAARTIESRRDRIATIFIAPLMTCSARLPVYSLLIAAFIPNTPVWGIFHLQGLVMMGLYLLSIPSALMVAYLLKVTALKGPEPSFIMELPTYKVPNLKNLFYGLKQRAAVFLKRAGKLILVASIALWVLSTYPAPPEDATVPAINYSIAGRIGHAIEPLVRPLGFDWRIATGLIPGFAAREVMVGALGTVFAIEAEDEEVLEASLATRLATAWSLPTALALLMWYVFSPQCLATFAVVRRETGSWGWTIANFVALLAMAYFSALITFQVATWAFA